MVNTIGVYMNTNIAYCCAGITLRHQILTCRVQNVCYHMQCSVYMAKSDCQHAARKYADTCMHACMIIIYIKYLYGTAVF